MTRRYDVSNVPMQGGYVAKRCPVRAQNDTLKPAEPVPASPLLERRLARGRQFEEGVFAKLLELNPDAPLLAGEDRAQREQATLDAMKAGVVLILGGRLPSDFAGRRVGEPDLLIATASGGYRAVDVKHHMVLDVEEEGAALCSSLAEPAFEAAQRDTAMVPRKKKEDLLQLAHYQRMLEAAGLAPPDGRQGGIIGVEGRVVWYDLDEPIWRTPSSEAKTKMRTTMEIYDFEFDFRLDIIAVAEMYKTNPTLELKVPILIGECADCPWRDYCRAQLEVGSGDVSLLPRLGWTQWSVHRDHGVRDRASLAALDITTAQLVDAKVDLNEVISASAGQPPETPIANVGAMSRRPKQVERLASAGILTVADLSKLDAKTAAYSGSMSSLGEQIDLARAALGPDPFYRRRGVTEVTVPRADVEVDVDMENVEDGVYLWGMLQTERAAGIDEYSPFVTWEPLNPESEAENLSQFWQWLMELRANTIEAGRTFRAYCYSNAENTQLRRIGLNAGLLDEIEAFIGSDEWVDMLRVFNEQFITGKGSGLKPVATSTGFVWAVDDPGGGEAMLYYDVAVGVEDEATREGARAWLLAYNRSDVEATLALRDYLESTTIPPIETLDP